MHHDIAEAFSQFFDFAAAATASDPEAKLFVHCEVGVSRSATLVIALLMKTDGTTFGKIIWRILHEKKLTVLESLISSLIVCTTALRFCTCFDCQAFNLFQRAMSSVGKMRRPHHESSR